MTVPLDLPGAAILVSCTMATVIAAFTLGGWNERVCAALLLMPASEALATNGTVQAAIALSPSIVLLAGLDIACFLGLLRVALAADRWFPMVMAAAALIGLVARILQFTSLGGPYLYLLQMPAGPLAVMACALALGVATKSLARRSATLG